METAVEKWLEEIHDLLAIWAALDLEVVAGVEKTYMRKHIAEKAREAIDKPQYRRGEHGI